MNETIRLLIVEDSQADALLVVLTLEQAGYQVVSRRVETAKQMADALNSEPWDLIISDHRLPRFSGPEALGLFQGSGLDIPFIMISGTMGEEAAVQGMKAGAHDYLMKSNLGRLPPTVRRELQEAENRRMRRAAEQSLRQSEVRYRQIVEAAAEGIWTVDTRLRTTFVNRRLTEILACEPVDVLGHSIFDFVSQDDLPLARARWKRPRADGIRRDPLDLRLKRADGDLVWTMVASSPMFESGKFSGMLGMVTDISERKQLENQVLQAEVSKKWFCREVLRAVTRGKFYLADGWEEVPIAGELVLDLSLASPEDYRRMREGISQVAGGRGMDPEMVEDLVLAAGEAATNVIKHAVGGGCRVYCDDQRVRVRVSDRGNGIRPDDLPTAILQAGFSTQVSLGMGYTLMLQLADLVWLATGPDGTLVQLEKGIRPDQTDPMWALLDRF